MIYGRRNSKPSPGVGIDWSHRLSQGLIAFYVLNDRYSLPINIVNKISAVSNNASWSNSPFGAALTFSGSQTLNITNDTYLTNNTGNGLSVAFLSNPAANVSNQHIIDSSPNSTRWYFVISQSSTDGTMGYFCQNGTNSTEVYSATGAADGNWHLFALSHTTTGTGGVQFYLDGQPNGTSQTVNHFPGQGVASNITIGQNANNNAYLTGSISFLAVWNRGLSAIEHAAFAQNYLQLFTPQQYRLFSTSSNVITGQISHSLFKNNSHYLGQPVLMRR